jgi:hypothetical protein
MENKKTREPGELNEYHQQRNDDVLKEAREMWKNPPSIEKAREQVARIKKDMMNDKEYIESRANNKYRRK